ncbi:uncharacterized protein LOC104908557 [Beta vulgaris subsp. vulgaris]|uniref:uncharacterized protein LOC104908557 n=1 Tax=Beta vulgaris subsp. vulgaris TaxID=3555 RepID=UPI0020376731|nr:uncharacterized protein LOC104908557 [Beta vulgaris subsp. vulgaris]
MELQQGKILSRRCAHIHAADPRKPIYLLLFAQSGWTMEKDPVVILNLSSNDLVSSFWMVHQHTKSCNLKPVSLWHSQNFENSFCILILGLCKKSCLLSLFFQHNVHLRTS